MQILVLINNYEDFEHCSFAIDSLKLASLIIHDNYFSDFDQLNLQTI